MPRRILILSWEYPPIVEGGLARHVRKLSEGLVAPGTAGEAGGGIAVHVLTRGREGDVPEEVRAGVRVHRMPEPATPRDLDEFVAWVEGMNEHMLAAGRALTDRYDFDVIHGHDWLVARAAAALARAARRPYLTTVHATEYGRHQGWVDKHPQSYIHGVERWMVRRAEGVVVCSHYMQGHVADVFGIDEAKIEVIPNGIDPLDLAPVDDLAALRARFADPTEKLVLLIGRLVYEKGFQIALDALPRVIARLDGVRFLVAGSGTHEAELKAQARRLGLERHGSFLGWIGDDVLRSLYRIADLCVVPSIYEPFGLVALEAMASGCPCIVADTGGLREVVPNEDVGLRFRSRDPRSLAQMMEWVLANPALRFRLVTEASAHVARFDWADVARRTNEVYDALSTRGAKRRPATLGRRGSRSRASARPATKGTASGGGCSRRRGARSPGALALVASASVKLLSATKSPSSWHVGRVSVHRARRAAPAPPAALFPSDAVRAANATRTRGRAASYAVASSSSGSRTTSKCSFIAVTANSRWTACDPRTSTSRRPVRRQRRRRATRRERPVVSRNSRPRRSTSTRPGASRSMRRMASSNS